MLTPEDIVITENIEDILKYNNYSIWVNVVQRAYGDVKTSITIYSIDWNAKQCLTFAQWLAVKRQMATIGEFTKNLPYGYWNMVREDGNMVTIVEDLAKARAYSEEEDGLFIGHIIKSGD